SRPRSSGTSLAGSSPPRADWKRSRCHQSNRARTPTDMRQNRHAPSYRTMAWSALAPDWLAISSPLTLNGGAVPDPPPPPPHPRSRQHRAEGCAAPAAEGGAGRGGGGAPERAKPLAPLSPAGGAPGRKKAPLVPAARLKGGSGAEGPKVLPPSGAGGKGAPAV